MAISKRKAWCNNEVAYIAWEIDQRIEGLFGFMLVRLHQDGEKRLLPAWVAFKGQSNPNWKPQDTSVWPIQKFEWRDLTLRRSRDAATTRPSFTCRYQIWPVGAKADGRMSVSDWRASNPDVFSSYDRANFIGDEVPLYICGDPVETNDITPRLEFTDFKAAFTNGILSTQNLRLQLHTPAGVAPSAAALKKQHTEIPGDSIRKFLSGDVLPTITGFFDGFAPEDQAYAALYELTDKELIGKLTGLEHRLHLILSTAGDASKTNPAWDTENHEARGMLHQTAGEMIDRLFNTTSRIGHNKFVVQVGADGKAKSVLTGSTNFSDTGLCTQSNNTIISTSSDLADHYLQYWHRLKADTATFPLQQDTSLPNHNVQQRPLRDANGHSFPATDINAPVSARLWCSPNTAATSKTSKSPAPADLADVFSLMRAAQQAILFLTFMPSPDGVQSIIEMAVELGKENTDLLVLGAISSPQAMPNYVASPAGGPKLPAPSVFSPEGAPKVLTVRAAAVGAHYGDFEPELLSAGFAIIHDKIVVIDPFSPDCVVVTGSHNLGFKASYANDDNLLIIQGDQDLAQAYAVHVLDVFEHYRFRAVLEQRERDRLASGGPASDPQAPEGGFLNLDDKWQDDYLSGARDKGMQRFL